ncbi:MAG: DUF2911 domain-containing protein [Acidobacteria bacterium]|nr:DUF2911 domain-containing protein [Acidobacteriota bacterium]
MKIRVLIFALIVCSSSVLVPAQRLQVPQVSQKASVMQRIGLTDVSVTYSRPAVRGRKVYGDWPTSVAGEATLDDQNKRPKDAVLVPWGHVWRAGANEATVFATNDDVLINGKSLPAGRYELAAIPTKDGDWTIIFNKDADQWGAFNYDAGKDVLRVPAKASWANDSAEFLTYSIDNVTEDSAVVTLRWEKAVVPFTVKVPDVSAKAMQHLRDVVAAAKPDDFQTPGAAATYAKGIKMMDDANKFYQAALNATEVRLKTKEDFANLRSKASVLFAWGKNDEAIPVAEKAIAAGKADPNVKPTDIAALEKRIADAKAPKSGN